MHSPTSSTAQRNAQVLAQYHEKRRARLAPLLSATDGHCWYCGTAVTLDVKDSGQAARDTATIDHQTPTNRGGSDDETNLVAACFSCNSAKGNKTTEEYREMLRGLNARKAGGAFTQRQIEYWSERGVTLPEFREPPRVFFGEAQLQRLECK